MASQGVEELVSSLLYEGYALYPYTQVAKNATPTPFGIVYPPDYASQQPKSAAFSILRVECVLEADPDAELSGVVRFLQASGQRHEGTERKLELGPARVDQLVEEPVKREFTFDAGAGGYELRGRVAIRAEGLGDRLWRIKLCVHNDSKIPISHGGSGASRGDALRWSLVSVHPLLETAAGRFISPVEADGEAGAAAQACESVNTFPVLASPEDDVVLGAAIVIPDHPQLAPESLGNLFDNTEIEEALVLHVQVLSDEEREAIAEQDPKVREMIARAQATTNTELLNLHGRLQPSDEGHRLPQARVFATDQDSPRSETNGDAAPTEPNPGLTKEPPASGAEPGLPAAFVFSADGEAAPAPGLGEATAYNPIEILNPGAPPIPPIDPSVPGPPNNPGDAEYIHEGVTFRRGDHVLITPGDGGDSQDVVLRGQRATIERIYTDYEDGVHFAVTIDSDPGQDLMSETGRYLFFGPGEVSPIPEDELSSRPGDSPGIEDGGEAGG